MLTPHIFLPAANHLVGKYVFVLLILCGLLVWIFPNTQQITERWRPVIQTSLQTKQAIVPVRWAPGTISSIVTAFLLAACIMSLSNASDFIYFQF